MILVTVGTEQYPFNSLMSWIDLLIRDELINRDEEVIVQYGASRVLPDQVKIFKRLPESEFKALLEQARVVISHCGEGSAMLLESLGKPYILVPRIQRFGEHVDNHQLDMAIAMEKQGIPIARSPGDLVRFLSAPKAAKFSDHNEDKLCKFLSKTYNEPYKKIMVVCSSGGHFKYAQSLNPFLKQFPDICWVTFKTVTTESELKIGKQRKYWAYSPTNRNLPNLIRNIVLAFKVLNQERPDVVLSTGAGVAVPFLIIAKFFFGKKTVFIESKTRLKQLSLSAKILQSVAAVDKLIVRSKDIKIAEDRTEFIEVNSLTSIKQDFDNSLSSLTIKETAFLKTSRCLSSVEVPQFKQDFRDLCELAPKKIVIDLSSTVFISSSGLGALVNSLKLVNSLNIKLVLWSVNPQVMSVLSMSKLNEAFTIEAATSAVRPQDKKSLVRTKDLLDAPEINFAQRPIDIAVAIVGLLLTAILIVPIVIMIKLESSGSIFCVQNRYGMVGKHFKMRIFRSKSIKATASTHSMQKNTKFGRFLRKTNLDKLPLFWNVLMGDMSLVGPRASTIEEVDYHSTQEWKTLQVKPGMLSEWRVNDELSERCCQSTVSVLD